MRKSYIVRNTSPARTPIYDVLEEDVNEFRDLVTGSYQQEKKQYCEQWAEIYKDMAEDKDNGASREEITELQRRKDFPTGFIFSLDNVGKEGYLRLSQVWTNFATACLYMPDASKGP